MIGAQLQHTYLKVLFTAGKWKGYLEAKESFDHAIPHITTTEEEIQMLLSAATTERIFVIASDLDHFAQTSASSRYVASNEYGIDKKKLMDNDYEEDEYSYRAENSGVDDASKDLSKQNIGVLNIRTDKEIMRAPTVDEKKSVNFEKGSDTQIGWGNDSDYRKRRFGRFISSTLKDGIVSMCCGVLLMSQPKDADIIGADGYTRTLKPNVFWAIVPIEETKKPNFALLRLEINERSAPLSNIIFPASQVLICHLWSINDGRLRARHEVFPWYSSQVASTQPVFVGHNIAEWIRDVLARVGASSTTSIIKECISFSEKKENPENADSESFMGLQRVLFRLRNFSFGTKDSLVGIIADDGVRIPYSNNKRTEILEYLELDGTGMSLFQIPIKIPSYIPRKTGTLNFPVEQYS